MKIKKIVFILLFLLSLICFSWLVMNFSVEKDNAIREQAEDKVTIIQNNYNNGDLLKIYDEGTNGFKKTTPKDSFVLFMNGKKEILGNFIKSDLLISNVINSNIVVLTYRSTYENYSLIEEFKFSREKNGQVKLSSYFIDDNGQRGELIMLKK